MHINEDAVIYGIPAAKTTEVENKELQFHKGQWFVNTPEYFAELEAKHLRKQKHSDQRTSPRGFPGGSAGHPATARARTMGQDHSLSPQWHAQTAPPAIKPSHASEEQHLQYGQQGALSCKAAPSEVQLAYLLFGEDMLFWFFDTCNTCCRPEQVNHHGEACYGRNTVAQSLLKGFKRCNKYSCNPSNLWEF